MNLKKIFFLSSFVIISGLALSACSSTTSSATILTPIQSQTQTNLQTSPSFIAASPTPDVSQMSDTDLDKALNADWGKDIDTQFQQLQTNLQ